MDNPKQLNYTQQLEHRLAMVLDDIGALVDYLDENNLMEVLNNPTKNGYDAWTYVINIEHACDLRNNECLSWILYNTTK
jgi:GTP cyclohydrolase III